MQIIRVTKSLDCEFFYELSAGCFGLQLAHLEGENREIKSLTCAACPSTWQFDGREPSIRTGSSGRGPQTASQIKRNFLNRKTEMETFPPSSSLPRPNTHRFQSSLCAILVNVLGLRRIWMTVLCVFPSGYLNDAFMPAE